MENFIFCSMKNTYPFLIKAPELVNIVNIIKSTREHDGNSFSNNKEKVYYITIYSLVQRTNFIKLHFTIL